MKTSRSVTSARSSTHHNPSLEMTQSTKPKVTGCAETVVKRVKTSTKSPNRTRPKSSKQSTKATTKHPIKDPKDGSEDVAMATTPKTAMSLLASEEETFTPQIQTEKGKKSVSFKDEKCGSPKAAQKVAEVKDEPKEKSDDGSRALRQRREQLNVIRQKLADKRVELKRAVAKAKEGQRKMTPKVKDFFAAVRAGKSDEVRRLLREDGVSGDLVDSAHPDAPPALLLAACRDDVTTARTLLRARRPANVNKPDRWGRRPIWWAAKNGNGEMVQLLCQQQTPCDVNTIDQESGCQALYRAILSNSAGACRALVHAGSDVNLRRLWNVNGESEAAEAPLMKAVQVGNQEICDILINSLCDIQAKTVDGVTCLHFAVGYRRYRIAELLLENRAKPNAQSRKGITPMTIAISEHLPAMVKILIEYGYNTERAFDWGETPLDMAIRYHAEDCALTMVYYMCNVKTKSKDRRVVTQSYFEKAAGEGLVQLMKMLLEVEPMVLQDQWLLKKELPLALYQKPKLYEWLYDISSSPRPLTYLCKGKIIKYLGKYWGAKLNKLPLPDKMMNFMRFDEYIQDEMFKERTVDHQECPYDCLPACMLHHCPVIEFSESDDSDVE